MGSSVMLYITPIPSPLTPLCFASKSSPNYNYNYNYNYLTSIPSPKFHHRHCPNLLPLKSSSRSPSETDCPVPVEQLPINEYQNLSTSFPFSWASGDFVEYCSRLLATGVCFALFIGLPVVWFGAVGADSEPVKRSLSAVSSGILVVTIAVLRMYLGWAYVGNRLLSATVECNFTNFLFFYLHFLSNQTDFQYIMIDKRVLDLLSCYR